MAESTVARSRSDKKRGNGEGSLYEYRGRWRAALTWLDGQGIRRRRVISAPTFAEARQKLTVLRADLDKGREPAALGTVGEYLTGWLDTARQDIRPATWRQRDQVMRTHVIPRL